MTNEIEFYEKKLKEARYKLWLENRKQAQTKVIEQKITKNYSLYNGDCVEVLKSIPNDSLHYSIFSPPFSSLFVYSASVRDMGNSSTDDQFYEHFKYITQELYRIIMPGRLISFHCSDIPAMKERDGYIGLKDFPGILLRVFESVGFIYHSKVLIKKSEIVESLRTRAIGLAHKQVVKDSAICRNGLPDYIITVRKPGINPEPIARENGFEIYTGTLKEPEEAKNSIQAKNRYSQEIWRRYAASIWMDIRQGNTLNFVNARDSKDERHICPLQLDVIERCLTLWTNPNDVVLSPFAGIGSEGYVSLKMNRKFIGIELKEGYYKCAVKNLKKAEKLSQKKGLL